MQPHFLNDNRYAYIEIFGSIQNSFHSSNLTCFSYVTRMNVNLIHQDFYNLDPYLNVDIHVYHKYRTPNDLSLTLTLTNLSSHLDPLKYVYFKSTEKLKCRGERTLTDIPLYLNSLKGMHFKSSHTSKRGPSQYPPLHQVKP